jgi:transposase
MLKIVFPICCGIDVHKDFVVACIAKTNDKNVTTYLSKRFSTFTNGLRELSEWLCSNSCKDVCMESTGKYWHPVFNILENSCNVVVAHPKYVKAIRGKKTDNKDARWIADLFKHDLVVSSFIPNCCIRQLRDLCRYYCKLTGLTISETQRTQNCLTTSNIQLANVVSDIFGKSSQRIIAKILEDPADTTFDIKPLLHGSMLSKVDDISLAIDGFISQEQAAKLKIIEQHYYTLKLCKANLENVIFELAKPYEHEIALLQTIPGISSKLTAIRIISEVSNDVSAFPTSKHLCSWAGLTPQNNESAGKKKSVRISKAGCYIKPLLVQCGLAALKSKDNPEISNRYKNLKMRRGHKKAIIAIARMLMTVIYHLLQDKVSYDKELYSRFNQLPTSKEITIEQAISLAKRQGYKLVC